MRGDLTRRRGRGALGKYSASASLPQGGPQKVETGKGGNSERKCVRNQKFE